MASQMSLLQCRCRKVSQLGRSRDPALVVEFARLMQPGHRPAGGAYLQRLIQRLRHFSTAAHHLLELFEIQRLVAVRHRLFRVGVDFDN